MSGSPESPEPRPYRSGLRDKQAAQTRRSVLAAAHRLFGERGWESTNMRDVAASAGVSVETLYARFGSKAELLKVVLDVAVVGDDEPAPLAERALMSALGDGPTVAIRAKQAARLAATINERVSPLHRALAQGAAVEPLLLEQLKRTHAGSRASVRQASLLVAGRRLSAGQVDELWTLTNAAVYDLLTVWSGWTRARYERWLTQRIVDVVGDVVARPVARPSEGDAP